MVFSFDFELIGPVFIKIGFLNRCLFKGWPLVTTGGCCFGLSGSFVCYIGATASPVSTVAARVEPALAYLGP